jgi:hypothetical protein
MSDIKNELVIDQTEGKLVVAGMVTASQHQRAVGRPKLTEEQKAASKAHRKQYLQSYYKTNEEKYKARYTPCDYTKSIIYRVYSPETDRFYIGSTARPLQNRLAEHRRCILRRSNRLYETMADLSLIWEIEALCTCEAESREYLEQLEMLYIAQGSVDGKVLNTNKRYTPEALKALQQVMSVIRGMKQEHLPEIFKITIS